MAQSPCSFLPLANSPCSLFYSPFTYLETLLGVIGVPDHDGGRPKQINAWFLYTHMVYL